MSLAPLIGTATTVYLWAMVLVWFTCLVAGFRNAPQGQPALLVLMRVALIVWPLLCIAGRTP